MFANENGVYTANIQMTLQHPNHKQIVDNKLQDYLEGYWDYRVVVKRLIPGSFNDTITLELEVERGYTNQHDFAGMIKDKFMPSLRSRIDYVVGVLFKLNGDIFWPKQFLFTVNNAQKTFGYVDLQINHGGRYFYDPDPSSTYNPATYLDTGRST